MELRSKARALEPLLQLGKLGPTDAFVEELRLALEKRGLVKVKVLSSYADRRDVKDLAAEVSLRLPALLVDVVGNTFVVAKQ